MRVAVIGAGLSGLTVARMLYENNIEVTVFDKSKGTGGGFRAGHLQRGGLTMQRLIFQQSQMSLLVF